MNFVCRLRNRSFATWLILLRHPYGKGVNLVLLFSTLSLWIYSLCRSLRTATVGGPKEICSCGCRFEDYVAAMRFCDRCPTGLGHRSYVRAKCHQADRFCQKHPYVHLKATYLSQRVKVTSPEAQTWVKLMFVDTYSSFPWQMGLVLFGSTNRGSPFGQAPNNHSSTTCTPG